MSTIAALDEITEQLGPPARLRWVNVLGDKTAAVVRFRHKGAALNLSASGNFRLIFQLTDSEVETSQFPGRRSLGVGDIVTSFTLRREQVRVEGPADTIHLLFSPQLVQSLGADESCRLSLRAEPALRASAVQAFVAMALDSPDVQLDSAILSVARILREDLSDRTATGGLSPHMRRAIRDLLAQRISGGISVPELAEAAGLSLHHFIKVCRQTEGYTPHALLLNERINRAIALLSRPRARVDEVAITMGFCSPSHFVGSFRRLMGVTPAAFRNALTR
jgi:AraC family transcriptional regulator